MFLLDTHVVVWTALEPEKISRNASRAMNEARNSGVGLSIADITLFEIALLSTRNRIHLNVSTESFLDEVERRFSVLPINGHIAARSSLLPDTYPKDPMDRLIGATAIVQNLTLITADEQIRKSKAVNTLW